MNRLDNGKLRELICSHEQQPVLVFTDGASEGDLNTIGGLLFADGQFRYFSCHVPSSLVNTWIANSKHVIAMVELYAVIVARFVWSRFLNGRKAIAFVDNESAKEALVKGYSFNAHFRALLLQLEVAAGYGFQEFQAIQTRVMNPLGVITRLWKPWTLSVMDARVQSLDVPL